MKALELDNKNREELENMLQKLEAKLVKIRFGVVNKQYSNYKEIGIIKKDIAKVKTRLSNYSE